ncbi:MAG: TRAP transporter small permease subunit [Dehalococcoidales bacterium]|jgi:TRAP-type mannitol/chloroaromatic compound transport system permease small subunit|nr:TRAP transporter small permease subunit [Dehalococcoidales bacterium]
MIIEKLLNRIDLLSEWGGKSVYTIVLIAGFFLCVEVVARYIFNNPIVWIPMATSLLCAIFYFMIGAYTLLFKSHVGMDIFSSKLSQKSQNILEILLFPLFALFIVVLLWGGYSEMIFSVKIRETMPPPWYGPLWPGKIFMVLGTFLILLQGIANLLRNILALFGGGEP